MRATITKAAQQLWVLRFLNETYAFTSFVAAQIYAEKLVTRAYKEMVAYSIICHLETWLLPSREEELVVKLRDLKCIGITKRQYGYLRGIWERQKGKW